MDGPPEQHETHGNQTDDAGARPLGPEPEDRRPLTSELLRMRDEDRRRDEVLDAMFRRADPRVTPPTRTRSARH